MDRRCRSLKPALARSRRLVEGFQRALQRLLRRPRPSRTPQGMALRGRAAYEKAGKWATAVLELSQKHRTALDAALASAPASPGLGYGIVAVPRNEVA